MITYVDIRTISATVESKQLRLIRTDGQESAKLNVEAAGQVQPDRQTVNQVIYNVRPCRDEHLFVSPSCALRSLPSIFRYCTKGRYPLSGFSI